MEIWKPIRRMEALNLAAKGYSCATKTANLPFLGGGIHGKAGLTRERERVLECQDNGCAIGALVSTQDSERHRFTAHHRDVGSLTRSWDDFDYMHARFYTAYLGRMLSVDPVRGDVLSPQSFNLFAYVSGNPVNFVDPWGLMARSFAPRYVGDEVVVTGEDPCPDAPKGMSCETWEELKRFWEEAQRRSVAQAASGKGEAGEGWPLVSGHVPWGFVESLVREAQTNELLAYALFGPEGVPGLEPVEGPFAWLVGLWGGIPGAAGRAFILRPFAHGPSSSWHIGLETAGKRSVIHLGRHPRYGTHLALGFKGPKKAWLHVYFHPRFRIYLPPRGE